MKKNSGISLMAVVIMVVIMVILAGIAMSSGMESVNEAVDTKVDVEIAEIKKAVANKMIEIERNSGYGMPGIRASGDIVDYIYYVENLTNAELEEFLNGVTEERVDYYRILDSISAAALGVSSVQDDHYFIVDYYTGKVYGLLNMEAYKADHALVP